MGVKRNLKKIHFAFISFYPVSHFWNLYFALRHFHLGPFHYISFLDFGIFDFFTNLETARIPAPLFCIESVRMRSVFVRTIQAKRTACCLNRVEKIKKFRGDEKPAVPPFSSESVKWGLWWGLGGAWVGVGVGVGLFLRAIQTKWISVCLDRVGGLKHLSETSDLLGARPLLCL